MNSPTREELVRIAGLYYPQGYPVDEDDYSEPVLAFQRTPEYRRWEEACEKALRWEAWESFLEVLQASFPGQEAGDVTQPWMSACVRCCVYLKEPLAEGERRVTRVVGAVSLLAPLYIVYTTEQILRDNAKAPRAQLSFTPSETVRPYANRLAALLEQYMGCRPFPLELADVALPGLRIGHLNLERHQPTLLNAFFSESLANLP